MQLSLLEADVLTLERALPVLSQSWSSRFGVPHHIREAERATSIRFAAWGGREVSQAEYRRIAAYFGAVVRRRILSGSDHASSHARRLLVQASIESDLREAGWPSARARAEARRSAGLDVLLSGAA